MGVESEKGLIIAFPSFRDHHLVSGSIPVKWAATPLTWATSETSACDGFPPSSFGLEGNGSIPVIAPRLTAGCRTQPVSDAWVW